MGKPVPYSVGALGTGHFFLSLWPYGGIGRKSSNHQAFTSFRMAWPRKRFDFPHRHCAPSLAGVHFELSSGTSAAKVWAKFKTTRKGLSRDPKWFCGAWKRWWKHMELPHPGREQVSFENQMQAMCKTSYRTAHFASPPCPRAEGFAKGDRAMKQALAHSMTP